MKDFNFMIPQNIHFGVGALKKLPEILGQLNSDKVLLQKSIGNGIEFSEEIQKYVLKFEPQDTDNLEMNKVYGFDFELYAEKGNLKRTFVGQLHLTNEYTHTKDEV